ncbi:MAG: cadherin-like beta sandwich domain-containing protein [Bacilli bacterium]|nr:cadherin-like beta sandwich domain-containing protein [Bacilli bacterium]
MKKKKNNIKKHLYFAIFCVFLMSPFHVLAATHDFSLSAYDFDPTANDWEGSGTEDEIANGGYVEPGQVIRVNINYKVGASPVLGLQAGVNYDSSVFEVIEDGGEIYMETDTSTTYYGGIWPAAGTSAANKKKTNWVISGNNYANKQVRVFASDSQVKDPLETDGVIATFYLRVKDTVPAGTILNLTYDNAYTVTDGDLPKTTQNLSLTVFGTMNNDVSLSSLSLVGSNSKNYLLNPAFVAGTSTRTFSTVVPYQVSSMSLAATPIDPLATILQGGLGSKSLAVGDNSFNIVVQAQNGTQEIYQINIKRLSNDASLKTLSLTNASFDYDFSSSIYTYTATVPYATKDTSITATVNQKDATIKSGTGAWALNNYGATVNNKSVVVEAEDCKSEYASVIDNACTSKTYSVGVTRIAPSSDNALTGIKVDGVSVENFISSTLIYTLPNVSNATSSLNVTASLADTKATITGTGTKALQVGDNTISLVVTAEDGTKRTYQIHVRRLSNNGKLASLTVNSSPVGTLSPNFNSTFYDYYTYTYDSTVSSIQISATLEDTNATIVSGLGEYSTGDTSANIVTMAEDGTLSTYAIHFTRNKSTNGNLSSLSIDGYSLKETFSSNKTLYTAEVPGTISTIHVNAEAEDAHATIVSGAGDHALEYGQNTIQIRVKAENGSVKDYTLVVTRNKKKISALSNLTVNNQTVTGFKEDILTYDYGTIPFAETSAEIGYQTKDSDATVTGAGTISLKTGMNEIPLVVTAQDGVTKTTYTVKIYRTLSNNAYLKELSDASVAIDFDKTINSYTVSVPYETNKMNLKAVTEYKDATVAITGPSTLSVGENTYTITVTAEDGTLNVYTVKATRNASKNNNLSAITVKNGSTSYLNGFQKDKVSYDITVPNEVTSIDIGATLEDSTNATVTGIGSKNLSTGNNTFVLEVTAASGEKKTYTLNITRALNSNNTLSSLEVVDHAMTPTFSKEVTSYTTTVESDVSEVRINAAASVGTSTVTGTGLHTLQTGTNVFNIVVTAEDNSKKTYVVVVIRKASNDSTLSMLNVDGGILNEAFSPSKHSYTVNVANSTQKVTLSGTATDARAKSVTGLGEITLQTGKNTAQIVVTAEDNTSTTYTVVIDRAKNMNANLSNLALSGGYTFDQTFSPSTTSYTATVPNNVSQILVSATKEAATSSVTGTGNISLQTGYNDINVVVTAEDTMIKKTYKIRIFRALSNNAYLKELSSTNGLITPAFDKTKSDYTLTVPYEVTDANVKAVVEDTGATVSIEGNENLKVGVNTVSIIVTAEDGTLNTYKVDITRQPSSNNYLSSLSVKDPNKTELITVFNKTIMTYQIKVDNSISSIDIAALAEDSETTVKGTGQKQLQVGSNTFKIESISADGTVREYIVTITRAQNENADLKELSIEGYTLIPDFSANTVSYSLNVDSSVKELTIKASAKEDTSTIKGLGKVQIQRGLNTFNVEVTAESGKTKTYVIVVNKAASSNNYLASLLASEPFTPTFDREKTQYNMTVSNATKKVTLEAALEDPNASVVGSGEHDLVVGNNTITITVTAEDNTFRTYTVTVYREPSQNNYLSDLKIEGQTIQDFDRETLEYNLEVGNEVTQMQISGILEDTTATITGNGIIYLQTGTNIQNIVVTAENGTTRVYKINIKRALSSNNNLSLLKAAEGTLNIPFDPSVLNYKMDVPYETTKLTLTTVVAEANAVVEIEGNVDFQIGSNNHVYINVTAEDGTTKSYTIEVTRLPQANNFLTSLSLKDDQNKTYTFDIPFQKNTLSYKVEVDAGTTNLIVAGTKEATSSTVVGLGNITVTNYPYTHNVVVTSASGVKRTYSIVISQKKSSNANLQSITLNKGSLSPAFDKDVMNYSLKVASNIADIDIKALGYAGQTIIGDGVHTLNYGNNKITITVTAEDGTTKTYTINVERENKVESFLENILVTNGQLSPTFDATITDYTAYLSEDATSITITPKIANPDTPIYIAKNDGSYEIVNSVTFTDLSEDNVAKIKVVGTGETTIYTVTIAHQDKEKITSEVYGHTIKDGMITTVKINTTLEEMKAQLDNDAKYLKIYESDGTTEYKGNALGTGMIVKLFKNEEVIDQKVIVIKGDTDGNGTINAIDALKTVNHIIETSQLSGSYLVAADTTNDGTVDAIDALKIVNHIIGTGPLY